MRWLLAVLLVVHGLIHFMGATKAFGVADLPQLTQPVSRAMGVAWLAAGGVVLAAGLSAPAWPRWWWLVGALAVASSQVCVFSAWSDAKFGTIANVLVLVAVAYAFASQGPVSFRAEYRRAVDSRLLDVPTAEPVTEHDLAHLPALVQRYLRVTGAVGQPRPRWFTATWRGRIRSTPSEEWMEFTARQHNFVDEPSRFFRLDARRGGLPVDVLHAYVPGEASMRVRLLSAIPLVDARGPEPLRAETVTLLNDLCLLAPGALVDPSIRWEAIDERSVRASYTVGSNTVEAVLLFNDSGELIDFVSDDRLAASPDGQTFTRQRWSTPVSDYETFGHSRVVTRGEGWWHTSDGDYAYIELELLDLRVNPDPPTGERQTAPPGRAPGGG